MMKKGIYFIFISLLCCLLPTTLFAKSDWMNLDVSCPISDMKVSLYRVTDENYKLTGVFSNYSVDLKQDVQGAANALENRILMDGIEADAYATSDSSGKASFSGLESGIYLVVGKEVESNGVFYMPQVSLVSLSGDLSVDLKYETSNKASRIHVLKVWKKDNKKSRPKSIEVCLLRSDGIVIDKVKLNSAGTDWVEHLVDDAVQELLAGTVTNTTLHILLLQLIQSLELRPELSKVLWCRECFEISEHGITLQMSRLFHAHAWLTVRHLLHLLPNGLLIVAHVDAVAETLTHLLLTVSSRKTTAAGNLWKQNLRLYQYRCISLVEAANQLAGYLQHRLLVLTGRHGCSLEQSDVGSLAHRVAEEAERNVSLEIAHLYLGLHGRVALHARHGDEVHQICSKLGELRYLTLYEERALFGVKTSREVVESHLDDVLANFFGVVCIVGESLHVSHEDEHTVEIASVLQFDAAAERANVVTQVELTVLDGRP